MPKSKKMSNQGPTNEEERVDEQEEQEEEKEDRKEHYEDMVDGAILGVMVDDEEEK